MSSSGSSGAYSICGVQSACFVIGNGKCNGTQYTPSPPLQLVIEIVDTVNTTTGWTQTDFPSTKQLPMGTLNDRQWSVVNGHSIPNPHTVRCNQSIHRERESCFAIGKSLQLPSQRIHHRAATNSSPPSPVHQSIIHPAASTKQGGGNGIIYRGYRTPDTMAARAPNQPPKHTQTHRDK